MIDITLYVLSLLIGFGIGYYCAGTEPEINKECGNLWENEVLNEAYRKECKQNAEQRRKMIKAFNEAHKKRLGK